MVGTITIHIIRVMTLTLGSKRNGKILGEFNKVTRGMLLEFELLLYSTDLIPK